MAAKNSLEQKLQRNQMEAGQPANDQDRIGYGIISSVNHDTSQVKIKLLTADGQPGPELRGGYLPLLTPLNVIHLLYGALREGLVCRIYWKGKLRPRTPLVEVIGDETHSFLNKVPRENKIAIGPFQIFSGGMA